VFGALNGTLNVTFPIPFDVVPVIPVVYGSLVSAVWIANGCPDAFTANVYV
jgi:hypothetical protein